MTKRVTNKIRESSFSINQISQLFVKGGEDSIYGRLYENNMKNTSFYPLNEGIDYIIREPKSALISLGDPIRFYRNHHCEVRLSSFESRTSLEMDGALSFTLSFCGDWKYFKSSTNIIWQIYMKKLPYASQSKISWSVLSLSLVRSI